ncbi:LytR/AlgR family response regulator transcription factor [Marinicella sp. W31]|uniref:LytR/AlgR family response regulator transcription factor n=1 Tax=Marinicella sp. W31 TaxID=3023713 RepID=UPI0037578177
MTRSIFNRYDICCSSKFFRTLINNLINNLRPSQILPVFLLLAVVSMTAIFETAQQLYYINRYQLADGASFTELLKYQAIKWCIWLLYAYLLFLYSRKLAATEYIKSKDLWHVVLVIIGLVVLNILTISLVQMLMNQGETSWTVFWKEYVPFITFQKAPVYTLAYIAFTVIMIYYHKNKLLQVEVMKLGELKQSHSELYRHLSRSYTDQVSVLSLKVGTKQKIIPTDDIRWIEADDYCVNIYSDNTTPDSMRTSLKALEKQLGPHFLRVHRGAIVNMNVVQEMCAHKNSHIKLHDGTTVNVAQSKIKMVREYIAARAS